jgi:hypothetical protein
MTATPPTTDGRRYAPPMPRWPFRRRSAGIPTDAETAATMGRLSTAFITGMADDGRPFTWDEVDVTRVDDFCTEFLRDNPPGEQRHSMIMAMGAYLGELLVRHHAARWTYDPDMRAAIVSMPNGLNCYPHTKVAKRLEHGTTHSLSEFYRYAVTREVPPGSQIHTW